MCLACAIVSEGKDNGLNAQVQRSGSGLSLRLSSDLKVWLNSFNVQPGSRCSLVVVWIRIG